MALLNKTLPLEARITAIRAEIDAFIDERAAQELKILGPGVPLQVVRNLLIARAVGCQCSQYLDIKQHDDAAKVRETAA